MPNAQDGQALFNGGMDSRTDPWLLGETQYAAGINLEVRDGSARSRRGSRALYEWTDGGTKIATGEYRAPAEDQRRDSVLHVRSTGVWLHHIPEPPQKMTLPTGVTISAGDSIEFVQAFDYLYMLRGENAAPLRWDGFDTSDWEEVPDPVSGDAFPYANIGVYAYNRIWLASGSATVEPSDLLSEEFDLSFHSYEVNDGEGGRITRLEPFVDGSIVVGKTGSIHILDQCSGDLSNLSRYVVDPNNGCVAGKSMVRVGGDVLYLSKSGVRTIRLSSDNQAQLVDVPLSYPIPTLINQINWGAIDKARAVVFDNYYMLAVPFSGSSVNNAIIVYDLLLKAWIGHWTGMACEELFAATVQGESWLIGVTSDGNPHRLLVDVYADGVPGSGSYLRMNGTTDDHIDILQVVVDGFSIDYAISWISFDILLESNPVAQGFLFSFVGPGSLSAWVQNYKIYITHNSGWIATFDIADLVGTGWRTIALNHNGTELVPYIDGLVRELTYTVEWGGGRALWLPDLSAPLIRGFIGSQIVGGWNPAFDGGIKNFKIFKLDGSNNRTYHSVIALDEGAGAVANEQVNDIDCAITGCTWITPAAQANIESTLLTRAMVFGAQALTKTLMSMEVTVAHRDPSFSLSVIKDGAFEEDSVITALGYSTVAYDIHGKADWTGTGIDFADPYRKNYAPIDLTAGGIALESAGGTAYGVSLDKEQKHTELRFLGDQADHVQVLLVNTQGSIAVRLLALTANLKQFGKKSED